MSVSMHRANAFMQHDLDRGYVVIRESGDWVTLAHPGRTCLKALRDGPCMMSKDHRGRCSVVTFECDSCGKTRRGVPYAHTYDTNHDVTSDHCWFCVKVLGPYS